MRALDPAFAAHLASGATTICACWRINPNSGPSLGFTDHDRDIVFDGLTFEAASGFTASGLDQSLGLSIDNATATGALISDRLTEADIARGRFDGGEVLHWQVNWADPEQRVLMFRGELGEIRRGVTAFEVELRGLAERLNRPTARSYLPTCDAVLGDARCGVDVSDPAFRGAGAIAEIVDVRTARVSGLEGFEAGWFTGGALTWTSGDSAGAVAKVRLHRVGDEVELIFDRDLSEPSVGDGFAVIAGCDKRRETCAGKFANLLNFRGFPFMPGENWVTAYPVDGGSYQGGSRVR